MFLCNVKVRNKFCSFYLVLGDLSKQNIDLHLIENIEILLDLNENAKIPILSEFRVKFGEH